MLDLDRLVCTSLYKLLNMGTIHGTIKLLLHY